MKVFKFLNLKFLYSSPNAELGLKLNCISRF